MLEILCDMANRLSVNQRGRSALSQDRDMAPPREGGSQKQKGNDLYLPHCPNLHIFSFQNVRLRSRSKKNPPPL